uniref:Uncharacterized protein n=1 Tax=viral metagenome TaxID=1070528 RepID=A0A6M3JI79_9ZZZZ
MQNNNLQSVVAQSMQQRQVSFSSINFTAKALTINPFIQQLKALQQKTGMPVYIIGQISSTNNNGIKISLPVKLHHYNRLRFAGVYKTLLQHGIWAINPANVCTFGQAIKLPKSITAKYNSKTAPNMFNNHCMAKAAVHIRHLHRTNKRSASGCCAMVMVNCLRSVNSVGVLQEIQFAAKHNVNNPPLYGIY